jgi:putative transposase
MARYELPQEWAVQAYRFALDPTASQERALASHTGAARKAFNVMLDLVKKNLDQRAAERSYGIPEGDLTPSQGWSLAALRKTWNRVKHERAPWWQVNSKEAYNTGLDGLARGLDAWSKSRGGDRAGAAVGFPRFKSKHLATRSVRFTTGTIRVEPDRHHVTLPVVGTIHTLESTRKLARHRTVRGRPVVLRIPDDRRGQAAARVCDPISTRGRGCRHRGAGPARGGCT